MFDFFRRRCPSCGQKGLVEHASKCVVEGRANGLRVNPAWFWFHCVKCTARFKEKHYGDGQLEPADDDEWTDQVIA